MIENAGIQAIILVLITWILGFLFYDNAIIFVINVFLLLVAIWRGTNWLMDKFRIGTSYHRL